MLYTGGAGGPKMSVAQFPVGARTLSGNEPHDADIADDDLLSFALGFAGQCQVAPVAAQLLAEFGDVDMILASDPDELRARGGLSNRAVAILKLLHAFRTGARRGQLLH